MKKFFEKLKDLKNIVKFISFLSDVLSSIVEVYNKHYPQNEDKDNKETDKEK